MKVKKVPIDTSKALLFFLFFLNIAQAYAKKIYGINFQ